jgi:hypothetical protein
VSRYNMLTGKEVIPPGSVWGPQVLIPSSHPFPALRPCAEHRTPSRLLPLPFLQRNKFQMFPPPPPDITEGEPDPNFDGPPRAREHRARESTARERAPRAWRELSSGERGREREGERESWSERKGGTQSDLRSCCFTSPV